VIFSKVYLVTIALCLLALGVSLVGLKVAREEAAKCHLEFNNFVLKAQAEATQQAQLSQAKEAQYAQNLSTAHSGLSEALAKVDRSSADVARLSAVVRHYAATNPDSSPLPKTSAEPVPVRQPDCLPDPELTTCRKDLSGLAKDCAVTTALFNFYRAAWPQ